LKITATFICTAGLLLAAPAFAKVEGAMASGGFGKEMCIVDSPDVQENFRAAFVRQINTRGYTTRFVPQISDCPVVTTFTATYAMSGGWRRVLKIAQFRVLRDGKQIGYANFRFSHVLGANGKVEKVIGEMIATMLPQQ
jgi:hypothetical protein